MAQINPDAVQILGRNTLYYHWCFLMTLFIVFSPFPGTFCVEMKCDFFLPESISTEADRVATEGLKQSKVQSTREKKFCVSTNS